MFHCKQCTVDPQFNKPLHDVYNKVLAIIKDFPGPSNSKIITYKRTAL